MRFSVIGLILFIYSLTILSCSTPSLSKTAQHEASPKKIAPISAEAIEAIKVFPKAKNGMQRYVIYLQPQTNESDSKIELLVGKTMLIDCNGHRLIGDFKEVNIEGWGYKYYEYQSSGNVVSTKMGCPEPKHQSFVSGDTKITHYNSRLPIVVYVPNDFEVRYKIWETKSDLIKAD